MRFKIFNIMLVRGLVFLHVHSMSLKPIQVLLNLEQRQLTVINAMNIRVTIIVANLKFMST